MVMAQTDRNEYVQKLIEIDISAGSLSDWEIQFVADLIDDTPLSFTELQREKIDEIHEREFD